jgi:hypothetical protein
MSPLLAIFIITAFVVVLIFAIALCRAAQLGDEAQRLARRVEVSITSGGETKR